MKLWGYALIGAGFGTLAGISAFLISWEELAKHHLERRKLRSESLKAAALAFVFFFAIAVAVGWLLDRQP